MTLAKFSAIRIDCCAPLSWRRISRAEGRCGRESGVGASLDQTTAVNTVS
jgi:hypothetical protein